MCLLKALLKTGSLDECNLMHGIRRTNLKRHQLKYNKDLRIEDPVWPVVVQTEFTSKRFPSTDVVKEIRHEKRFYLNSFPIIST